MLWTYQTLGIGNTGPCLHPDAFPSLARSVQCLVFIGCDNVFIIIDYFSTSASTLSPTSSLLTRPRWLRLHCLRHRHPSSTIASTCLYHSPHVLCACGVSACWFLRLRFLSSLTIYNATVVHVTTATTTGGVLEIY
jgi:hypothetical protein